MEKLSQELGFFDKAREFTNLSGQWLELSQSEFKSIMQELRNADNSIREIVVGKNSANKRLKDVLNEVESNLNRREYLVSIAEVVTFKEVIDELNERLKSLNIDFIKSHYDLLAENLSPEAKAKLLSLKETVASTNYSLVKEAGLLDIIYNLFSSRSRTLKSLEQRYPRAIKTLKTTASGLFKACNSLYSKILNSLKRMKESRIKRNIEDYLTEKNRLIIYIDSFNSQFKSYYNSNLKSIINQFEPAFETGDVETEIQGLTESAIKAPEAIEIQTAPKDLSVIFTPESTETKEDVEMRIAPPTQPKKEIEDTVEAPTEEKRDVTPSNSATTETSPIQETIKFIPKRLFDELGFKFDDAKDASIQLQELCNKAVASLSSFKHDSNVTVKSENYVEDIENHINYALLANEVSININFIISKLTNLKDEVKEKVDSALLELKKVNRQNPIVYLNSENVNKICNSPSGSIPFKENIRAVIAKTTEKIKGILDSIKYNPEIKKEEPKTEDKVDTQEEAEGVTPAGVDVKQDDLSEGAITEEIDKSLESIKDTTVEKLDTADLAKTSLLLNDELKKIIDEIPEINKNNYKEICDKYIAQLNQLNNKINLIVTGTESLSEKDPIKLKIINISKVINQINIENFKKMYEIAKKLETSDDQMFSVILKKIAGTFNRLKEKSRLLSDVQSKKDISTEGIAEPIPSPASKQPVLDAAEKLDISSLSSVELNRFKINFYNNLPFRERVEFTALPNEELKNSFILIRLPVLNKKITEELDSLTARLNVDKSTIPSGGNKLELFNKLSDLKNELSLKLSKQTIQDLLKNTVAVRSHGPRAGSKITIPGEVEKLLELILSGGSVEEIKECNYGIQDVINYLIELSDKDTKYKDYLNKYDVYNCLQSVVADLVKSKNIDFTKLREEQKSLIKKIFTTENQYYKGLLGLIGGALHRQGKFELIKANEIPIVEKDLSDIPSEYLEPPVAYSSIYEEEKLPTSSHQEFNQIIALIIKQWKKASGMSEVAKNVMIKSMAKNINKFLSGKDQDYKSKFMEYLEKNEKSIRTMSADIDLPYVSKIVEELKKVFNL